MNVNETGNSCDNRDYNFPGCSEDFKHVKVQGESVRRCPQASVSVSNRDMDNAACSEAVRHLSPALDGLVLWCVDVLFTLRHMNTNVFYLSCPNTHIIVRMSF